MKALNIFVVVLVVFGVFGCADQSSVTSPASDIAVIGKAAPTNSQTGQWPVDKIIHIYGSKQNYLVGGTIDYVVTPTITGFTLTAGVKLETSNLSLPKSDLVYINETFVGHGEISKGNLVIFTKEYRIEDGLNLHLEFAIGEIIQLRDVSLVATPFIANGR